MLTSLSLWAIYFASYLLDYAIILVILIWKRIIIAQNDSVKFWNSASVITWSVFLILIVASIIIVERVRRIKMNTRIISVPEKNITYEMTTYLFAQVATVASTVFTDWWIPINLVLFIAFGVYFVKSKAVYTSPLFVLPLGNRVLCAGKTTIITNFTLQEMKIAQEDSLNGVQARELTPGVYYVRK